jgi:hypothetical protein
MASDAKMHTIIVRALTGAETNYLIKPLQNAESLYLEGFVMDVIPAEAQVGDAILVHITGQNNQFHSCSGMVASTARSAEQVSHGTVLPVTTAFTYVELQRPVMVCRDLPRHQFSEFSMQLKNAHTGANLTISNSGATRSLLTLKLRVVYRDPMPYVPGMLHPSLLAQTRFNEYL